MQFNENKALAMCYVPAQSFTQIYPIDKGFYRGTIFAELDKPFKGVRIFNE